MQFMKMGTLGILMAALVSAPSMAASADEGMIEMNLAGVQAVETPFVDGEGNALSAIPVQITQVAEGVYEAQPLEAAEAGSTDPLKAMIDAGAFPKAAIRFSSSQIISARIGVLIGGVGHSSGSFFPIFNGVLVEVEPGLGGGKVSVGIGSTMVLVGWSAKYSALKVWGPSNGRLGDTYAGPEFTLNMMLLDFSIGVLKNTNGADEILNIGLGAGW